MGLIGPACTPGNGFSGRVLIGRGLTHPFQRINASSPCYTKADDGSHPLPGSRTPPRHPRGCQEEVPYCCGGHGGGETPGPIPNPEAKPASAEGTAGETRWESRTPPHKPSRPRPDTPPTGGAGPKPISGQAVAAGCTEEWVAVRPPAPSLPGADFHGVMDASADQWPGRRWFMPS